MATYNLYINLYLFLRNLMHLKRHVLFRTWNLGQHFLDISKQNNVNQSLVSLVNDNY
jgi:hypothetical protein